MSSFLYVFGNSYAKLCIILATSIDTIDFGKLSYPKLTATTTKLLIFYISR